MSEHTDIASPPAAEAGWFGPEERPCFGWLHRTTRPSGTALVIVPPFGYEAVCAQRTLRHLAERAAGAGIMAVRFDLDGCGDSYGDDFDPGRLDAWLTSINDACALARANGATRLVLAGVRLGATLATLAARTRDDVVALALVNPVRKGAAWLREARALQAALALPAAPQPAADDDTQEVVGFAITPETRESIASIDLATLAHAPAPAILVVERDDMPGDARLSGHLRDLGAAVETVRLPGYAEMMLDPHETQVPHALIDHTVAWTARLAGNASMHAPTATRLRDSVTVEHAGRRQRWRCVRIEPGLFGILTEPESGADGRSVLLFNAGGIARVGPNRLYPALATRLAATGARVLRIDLSSIGDSATQPGEVENRVYHARATGDVAAVVAWVRIHGATTVLAGGLCSGGYHAMQAAFAGSDIDVLLMINPLTFDYREGSGKQIALRRDSRRYDRMVRNRSAWRKLLRGEVSLLRIVRVLSWRAVAALKPRTLDLMRTLHVPMPHDLGNRFSALARRGVRIELVLAHDDPGGMMLAEQAGNTVPALQRTGAMHIRTLDGPDHSFTALWMQPLLLDAAFEALSRRSAT